MAKLSPAQIKALTEVHELGYTNARKNTLDSIAKYLTATEVGQALKLNHDGREILGLTEMPEIEQTPEQIAADEEFFANGGFDQDLDEWQGAPSVVEEIESELSTNMWDQNQDTEAFEAIVEKNNLMAQWRGTDVWEDLSLEEIKEDIDTAFPINRKARREHYRNLRNAFRRKNVSRPRKALKITGKVGV